MPSYYRTWNTLKRFLTEAKDLGLMLLDRRILLYLLCFALFVPSLKLILNVLLNGHDLADAMLECVYDFLIWLGVGAGAFYGSAVILYVLFWISIGRVNKNHPYVQRPWGDEGNRWDDRGDCPPKKEEPKEPDTRHERERIWGE